MVWRIGPCQHSRGSLNRARTLNPTVCLVAASPYRAVCIKLARTVGGTTRHRDRARLLQIVGKFGALPLGFEPSRQTRTALDLLLGKSSTVTEKLGLWVYIYPNMCYLLRVICVCTQTRISFELHESCRTSTMPSVLYSNSPSFSIILFCWLHLQHIVR